jgi:hypothetical protein
MNALPSIGPHDRVAPAKNVHSRRFDDDLVIVDLKRGEYYALDAVGAGMWQLLVSGKTPAEVGSAIAVEYDSTEEVIVRDCLTLAENLVERGLLVRSP